MSRARRVRQQQKQVVKKAEATTAALPTVPHALLWLAAAFLLPNLGALACGFVLDDMPLIVENNSLHLRSLGQLAHIWAAGYWPDRHGQGLYRPVSQTVWALTWSAGGGHPWLFHAVGLLLGLGVVFLLYRFLLIVETPPRIAFIAAVLFALLPIHTEATTSVVGSAELLGAALGFGALICYYRDRAVPAVLLFGLAVFSKESAAAFAALPVVFPKKDWRSRSSFISAAGAGVMVAAAIAAHHLIAGGVGVPPIDNMTVLTDFFPRLLTSLWVQCLYLFKTLVPITLSADYSYKQIPLVMGLDNWRAWAGLALVGAAVYVVWRDRQFRAPILAYAVLFAATANILFPLGTIMGERLAYAPSFAIALLVAMLLAQSRYWKEALIVIAVAFGARSAVRNLDWRDADHFYPKLIQTSPDSAKAWYFYGILRSAREDDIGALAAYDRAIAIFPAYSEAYHNRGNTLVRLGRREEAMASYRQCLRFDPGHGGAAMNLRALQLGLPLNPPRRRM
ncbi:MAG TPA: tetratricopeptide repeat protein [Terriglobales bacterium]